MSDQELRERVSPLDAFAKAPESRGELLVPGAALPALSPSRPHGAIAVAVKRDDGAVLQKLKALAAAAGTDWYYRFPVRNRKANRTDYIEGPSIKLANDLARMYGNCEIETRVMDMGREWLIYARFTDLETGFAMERPFQQRKSQGSIGGGDDARALDIALQIGVSKAIRNVVVNSLQTFADFAFEQAKESLIEQIGKKLSAWKDRVALRLEERGIDLKRAEATMGRVLADWRAEEVARVVAMVKSIDDGMATVDETFPALAADKPADGEKEDDAGKKLDEFAEGERKSAAGEGEQGKPATDQRAKGVAADQKKPPADESQPKKDEAPDFFAMGRAHHEKGGSRRAIPGELRGDDRTADHEAWLKGFDSFAPGGAQN